MALVRKSAWAQAGGYDHVRHGWEDFDFWCAHCRARAATACSVAQVLADYRVHDQSMLHTTTETRDNRAALAAELRRRHSWLDPAHGVSMGKQAVLF